MWIDKIDKQLFDAWLSQRTSTVPSGNKDPFTSSMRTFSRLLSALNGNAESRRNQQITDLVSAQLYNRESNCPSKLASRLLCLCSKFSIPENEDLSLALLLLLEGLKQQNMFYLSIVRFWYSISKKVLIEELIAHVDVSYLISYFSVPDKNNGYAPLGEVIDEISFKDLNAFDISNLTSIEFSQNASLGLKRLLKAINDNATRSGRKEMFQALDIMFSFDKASTIDRLCPIELNESLNSRLHQIINYYSCYFSFSNLLFENKNILLKHAQVMIKDASLQQIYYGAPGTGKSFEINKITTSNKYAVIRTTFHPDSDYATFVGAYKPVMKTVDLRDLSGHKIEEGGKVLQESRITYKFVKQAFLKAYLAAWKKYAEGSDGKVQPQFLVIEEINRGNCAQIFGDLFQLLDRSDNGFSSYPIEADADLQAEIQNAFNAEDAYQLDNPLSIDGVVKDYISNDDSTLSDDVQSGRVLLLPNNLYIWATMNTSDQSLFPIDSAFKRRWDWRFIKIADAQKGWMIKCGTEACDWWTFISAINQVIALETNSDDKKLGYFFCKPDSNDITISEEKFVGKVLFYLWNDVFKDGDTSKFKVSSDAKEPSFEDFYEADDTGKTIVNKAALRQFLINVVGEDKLISDYSDDESATPMKGQPRFRLDGGEPKKMLDVVRDLIQKFAESHEQDSVDKIVEDINAKCQGMLDKINSNFVIETEASHTARWEKREAVDKHPVIVDLGGRGKIYVNRYWDHRNREDFIRIAKDNNWGVITAVTE